MPEDQQVVEQEAKEVGWRPQEEFQGDPEKWVDAAEFLRRGETMLPILRGNLRDLKKELKDRDRKHETAMAEITKTLVEFKEFASKSETRAYEKAVKDVRAEMKKAATEGDTVAYERAEADLEALTTKSGKAPDKPAAMTIPSGWDKPKETREEWLKENDWYLKDPWLGKEADALANHLSMNKIYPTMKDMLEEITRLMKEQFPEKFGIRRKGPDDVVGAGASYAGGKATGKRTFSDLPKEAQDQCKKFQRDIPGYTQEEYLKDYQWEA